MRLFRIFKLFERRRKRLFQSFKVLFLRLDLLKLFLKARITLQKGLSKRSLSLIFDFLEFLKGYFFLEQLGMKAIYLCAEIALTLAALASQLFDGFRVNSAQLLAISFKL